MSEQTKFTPGTPGPWVAKIGKYEKQAEMTAAQVEHWHGKVKELNAKLRAALQKAEGCIYDEANARRRTPRLVGL